MENIVLAAIAHLNTTEEKVKAACRAYREIPNTTEREEDHFEWLLMEIRAGRK